MYLGIKFKDGSEFIAYNDDSYYHSGCPTCDYGSEYVNEIRIDTTHFHIYAYFNKMYGFAFSTADVIKIFAIDMANMTEKEFVNHIEKSMKAFGPMDFQVTERK